MSHPNVCCSWFRSYQKFGLRSTYLLEHIQHGNMRSSYLEDYGAGCTMRSPCTKAQFSANRKALSECHWLPTSLPYFHTVTGFHVGGAQEWHQIARAVGPRLWKCVFYTLWERTWASQNFWCVASILWKRLRCASARVNKVLYCICGYWKTGTWKEAGDIYFTEQHFKISSERLREAALSQLT